MLTFTVDLPPVTVDRPAVTLRVPSRHLGMSHDDPPGPGGVVAPPGEPLPRARARCADGAGTLTALFFSDDPVDIARAKAVCRPCALREGCLSRALERGEAFGVWGGELLQDGAVVTHKRPRGRPPKHPRPELVVPEVPLPDWAA